MRIKISKKTLDTFPFKIKRQKYPNNAIIKKLAVKLQSMQ